MSFLIDQFNVLAPVLPAEDDNMIDMSFRGIGFPNRQKWPQFEVIELSYLENFDWKSLSYGVVETFLNLKFDDCVTDENVNTFWKPLWEKYRAAFDNSFPNKTVRKDIVNHLFAFHKALWNTIPTAARNSFIF